MLVFENFFGGRAGSVLRMVFGLGRESWLVAFRVVSSLIIGAVKS